MDDYQFQLEFVVDASWRLMSMQDANELSPSGGCFHYAYWRDKTSEFADARFQEAGPTLGLLSLSAFDRYRDNARLASSDKLYHRFSMALKNWSSQQYPDGCFDEWYKGERGFAATEFTMIAYGLAHFLMGDRIATDDRAILKNTMQRAGDWLADRHDNVKSNHEAAAAAALALAWKVTGSGRFLASAKDKVDHTLARATEEGWFPEIGGMDLGYCSVLLDYLSIYEMIVADGRANAAMDKLISFMMPHIHPDLTISPEAGLCLNPYVSRLGFGLSSTRNETAAAIVAHLSGNSPRTSGLTPYLADDLRLARWSHLAVVTILLKESFTSSELAADFGAQYPQGWTHRQRAAISAYHFDNNHVFVAVAGGGVLTAYRDKKLVLQDHGYILKLSPKSVASYGYDTDRKIETDDGLMIELAMAPANFFFPSFISRLILRIGCMVPLFSYWLRAGIDWYRIRNRTAVNQSSAPIASTSGGVQVLRDVSIDADVLVVKDTIKTFGQKFSADQLLVLSEFLDKKIEIEPFSGCSDSVVVTKRVDLASQQISSIATVA